MQATDTIVEIKRRIVVGARIHVFQHARPEALRDGQPVAGSARSEIDYGVLVVKSVERHWFRFAPAATTGGYETWHRWVLDEDIAADGDGWTTMKGGTPVTTFRFVDEEHGEG
jgi:hypothetical protein